MSIDNSVIDKLAELAKLEFDGTAKEEIKADLNKILDFVNKLNELDTEEVEPLVYMLDEIPELREDEIKEHVSQERALKNAPHKDSDYFKVPKVVNK